MIVPPSLLGIDYMAAVAAAYRRLDPSANGVNVRVFHVGGPEAASPNYFRRWSFGKRRSLPRSEFHDDTVLFNFLSRSPKSDHYSSLYALFGRTSDFNSRVQLHYHPRKLILQGVELHDTLVRSNRCSASDVPGNARQL